MPVTVTVCAVFQLPGVKVSAPDTVPSPVSLLAGVTVTSCVGSESSTTWKLAVPPASVVARPVVPARVMPAVSSSVMVTG